MHELVAIGASLACYLVIYLGLTRLSLRALAQRRYVGPVQGLIVCAALILLGVLIPLVVQYSMIRSFPDFDDYTFIQLPNLFWSSAQIIDEAGTFGPAWSGPTLTLVFAMAVIVFLMNMRTMAIQLAPRKAAIPARVAEEDASPLADSAPLPNPLD